MKLGAGRAGSVLLFCSKLPDCPFFMNLVLCAHCALPNSNTLPGQAARHASKYIEGGTTFSLYLNLIWSTGAQVLAGGLKGGGMGGKSV